jgi:hypothetical protein
MLLLKEGFLNVSLAYNRPQHHTASRSLRRGCSDYGILNSDHL